MAEVKIDVGALRKLKEFRHCLTRQQLKTLRGQVLAGDAVGAMKGLCRILANQ